MAQPQIAAVPAAVPADGVKTKAPRARPGVFPVLAVLVGVANLAGTGFVGHRLMTMPLGAAPAEHHETAEAPLIAGPTLALDPFVVNLNEPNSSRYLRVVLELELANAKAQEIVVAGKPLLRDELLRYLSGLTVADTQGEVAKQKIQDTLKARIDKAFGPDKVRRLFFADFVVQ